MSIFDLTSEEGLKKHEAATEYWWEDNNNCIISTPTHDASDLHLACQILHFKDYFDSSSSHLNAAVTLYNPIIPKDAIIKSCRSLCITFSTVDFKDQNYIDLNNVIYPEAKEVNIFGINTFTKNLIFHNMTLKNPSTITISGCNWIKNLSIIKEDTKKEVLHINISTLRLKKLTDLLDIHVINKGSTHICISYTPAVRQITDMLTNPAKLFDILDELAKNIENLNLIYFKSEIYQPTSQLYNYWSVSPVGVGIYPKYIFIKRNNNQWCIEINSNNPDISDICNHNSLKLLTTTDGCVPVEYTEINNTVNLTNDSFTVQNYTIDTCTM